MASQSPPLQPPILAGLHESPDGSGDRNDGSLPLYRDAGDTAVIVHVVRCGGVAWSAQACNKTHLAGARVRIPRGALPEANGDHHLSIDDVPGARELDFWGASVPSDTPESPFDVLTAGQCPYDGDGTGCSGSTATDIATSLGAIDPMTLAAVAPDPHGALPYALATQALCASHTWVFPADYSDGANTDGTPACRSHLGPDGRPPEGVRYFLDISDADIDATDNAPYVKAILRTLDREHYGGTIVDTNWSGARGPAFTLLRSDWNALVTAAGRPPGTRDLPLTTNGIDLAAILRFCTNGTC